MHMGSGVVDMHLRAFLTLGFNPFAPNNTNSTPDAACKRHENGRGVLYHEERVIEMEQGSLIPLVVSATGGVQGNHSPVSMANIPIYCR